MTGAGFEINKDAEVGIKKAWPGLRPGRIFQRFRGRARECKEVHIIDRNVASLEHITGISRVSTGYLSFEWRSHKATLRSHSVASPRVAPDQFQNGFVVRNLLYPKNFSKTLDNPGQHH